MITSPKKRLGVCAGEKGTHSLRVAKPWQGAARLSAEFEIFAKAF